jgi:hypothetical protein
MSTPTHRRRFYRLAPTERGEAVLPLVGRNVTGQYRDAGGQRRPFAGQLVGLANDPVRRLAVAVVDPKPDCLLVLALSSIYDIEQAPQEAPR